MSKRLQILLDDEELQEIKAVAKRSRMSVSSWVRTALREARLQKPRIDTQRKLQTIRAAVPDSFPTADIDQMLAEIGAGYGGPPST